MIDKDKQAIRDEALAKLLECSYRQDTPLMMKNDNGVFGLIFDTRKIGLSEFKYTQLWYAINQAIRNDDRNWMYRYWEFANQYYRDVFEYGDAIKERSKYQEFHVAVGGLLALNEEDAWIDHIAFFSNCLPAKYFLIPSTFSEIFDWLTYFSQMVDTSVDLDVRYHLYSQYEGVRAGANLYKGIIRYLALMMCRLPKMDFNVRYADPLALPHVYGDAVDEKKNFVSVNLVNVQNLEILKENIQELDNQNEDDKLTALLLLDSYIEACKNKINAAGQVDNDKIEKISATLLSEFNRQQSVLITENDSNLKSIIKHVWFAESTASLEEYDFLKGRDYNNINRESLMVHRIIDGIIFKYNEVLKSYSSKVSLCVRYKDIPVALDKLRIPKDFTILVGSIGNHLLPKGYTASPNAHFVYSRQPEIIIMRNNVLPFASFERTVCDKEGYELIDKDKSKVLYSNIWKIRDNEDAKNRAAEMKLFYLVIGCYAAICMPPENERKCIRIKAVDGITQDTFDLDKIMCITEYKL